MCSMIDLCFLCPNDKCKEVDNQIVTQAEYLMPEITIFKLRLPLHICSICEKNLQLFSKFKKDCVEYSLRLEARIREAQDTTDRAEKYTTSKTNINDIHEVHIKEEMLDESETLIVKDFVEDITIKEDPLNENPYNCEYDDVLRNITKEESSPQTDTHLYEDSSVDIDEESDQNSDPDVVSVNKEFNINGIHIKIHMGKRVFQCNECKKWFNHKSDLKRHIEQHGGVKDFQCKECKKWFLYKSNLVAHMKIHIGVKDFQCDECKKWFSSKSHLVAHMKIHIGVKKFQCNVCKKWFLRESGLNRHMTFWCKGLSM